MACSCFALGISFSISSCSFLGVDFGNPNDGTAVFSDFSGIVSAVVCLAVSKCKGIRQKFARGPERLSETAKPSFLIVWKEIDSGEGSS